MISAAEAVSVSINMNERLDGFTDDVRALFREILFIGTDNDIDRMLTYLRDMEVEAWQGLCSALESLRFFRAHYKPMLATMSETDRVRVARYDADWTMSILRMIGDVS